LVIKLNLGCGRDIRRDDEGEWINVDSGWQEGMDEDIDLVVDLDDPGLKLPFDDGTVDEIFCSHIVEHLARVLPLVEELWRVSVDGGVMVVRCPYGSSDDAWEDPTHVRALYPGSFLAWGAPYYWRSDYGYRGDWKIDRVVLFIGPDWAGESDADVRAAIMSMRNVVREMVVGLVAVKPARPATQDLLEPVPIAIRVT
jgi:SAM-dependent methyltransferase